MSKLRTKRNSIQGKKAFKSATDALSKCLHKWREEEGLTLRDVATRLDLSVSTVSTWENGTRFPSGEHLLQLSKLMDVPICGLVYESAHKCPVCRRKMKHTSRR